MGATVTEKWTPEGKRFVEEMKALKQLEICVGFQSSGEGDNGELDVVDVAAYNEFGTYAAEARPFMKTTVEKHGESINKMLEACIAELQGGATAEHALNKAGVQGAAYMRQTITEGGFKANAPITVAGGWMKNKKTKKMFRVKGKGTTTPLIAGGRMRQSVTYVVRPKEK